jgi:hypothetical protein
VRAVVRSRVRPIDLAVTAIDLAVTAADRAHAVGAAGGSEQEVLEC